MVDVDVSLDFPVGVSSLIEIGNGPGVDEATDTSRFGAVFSGEIDTSRSFLAPAPKFGVSFKASVTDDNKRIYERVSFGATFSADYLYNEPAPAPQPGTPHGQDMSFFTHHGWPVMHLPLLPAALGQRPNAEIHYEFKDRRVRSQTHIEQRMNLFHLPFRTYTFDYVITPQEQFAIQHIMENTDRFLVAVPLFPEMYRLSGTVKTGETDIYMIVEPEFNLYHSEFVFLIDGPSKHGCFHKIEALNNDPTTNDELNAGSMTVSPGAAVEYGKSRYALFPVLIGWVDSFEPETVNRKTVAGSLTVREGWPSMAPRGPVKRRPPEEEVITDPFDVRYPGYNERAIMTEWVYGMNNA